MARVSFSVENKKVSSNFNYPKLRLTNGEHARIVLLEDPHMEYVHTLKAPQIKDGKPVTFMAERKDKTQYEDYRTDFLSRPLCIGDESILEDKAIDTKNCPMCAMAKNNPDKAQAPQRRFAMHVIRYRTKPGGHQLVTPFSVETVVWSFTDTIFSKLIDFKEEWGDLKKHDLTLGPCTNDTFQKFEISISAKAEWTVDKARQLLTAQTFKENQIEDLSIACGAKKELRWIEDDLSKINEAWDIINESEKAGDSTVGTLDEGIDDILNGSSEAKTSEKTSGDLSDLLGGDSNTDEDGWSKSAPKAGSSDTEDSDPLADLLGEDGDTDEESEDIDVPEAAKAPAKKAPAKKAPAKEAPAKEEASDDSDGSFDDLLNGLD
jgi:hypothetical protein